MEILYVLVPIALGILGLAVGIFFWAVKTGQYDDMEGPAHRILMDDEQVVTEESEDHPDAGRERGPRG